MRLHGSQIAFRASEQLRPAAVMKRIRMQMPHASIGDDQMCLTASDAAAPSDDSAWRR